MYLPKSVSTSASWGLRTFRPRKGTQPKLIHRMPRIIRGTKPMRPASIFTAAKMTRPMAARYSRANSSSMAIPFFLLFNTFSFMESTSF